MGKRSRAVVSVAGLLTAVALAACTSPVVVSKPHPIGPNPTLEAERTESALIRDVCSKATMINTLVRLPDLLITGADPVDQPISEQEWLDSVLEAKERAVDMLRGDTGDYDDEIVAFTTAVIAVSTIPPTSLENDNHAELTSATAPLGAICDQAGWSIGIVVPPSFGG